MNYSIRDGEVGGGVRVFYCDFRRHRPSDPLLQNIEKDSLERVVARELREVADSVPSVLNMGLKDALYLLENKGYRVKFSGKGRVITQNPLP